MIRALRTIAVLAVCVIPFLVAAPAAAQATDGSAPDQVMITGTIDVAAGETVGNAVLVDGTLTVEGTVDGNVFLVNGDLTISGTVRGDVVALNGTYDVTDTASIEGDLVTGGSGTISQAASIRGDRSGVDVSFVFGRAAIVGAILAWIAVAASTFALGALFLLVAPRATDAIALAGTRKVGPSIGWGFVVFFGLPVAGVIALVTLVGIPLGVAILFALASVYPFGYVASAFVLGRRLVEKKDRRFISFLAGWGVLTAATLVPFLSGIVWVAAMVFGLGVITVAIWGSRGRAPTAAVPIPPPPAPPVPA